MNDNRVLNSTYFYGNKVSEYGLEHGWVDYSTLAKSFDAVLNNDIIQLTDYVIGNWEIINGSDYDEEYDSYHEVFQYYIISESGAEILGYWTDEIIYYNEKLDMYVWGVTHWGTSWDYVLTNIRISEDALA